MAEQDLLGGFEAASSAPQAQSADLLGGFDKPPAQLRAVSGASANPEEAGKVLQFSKKTATPPSVIEADLPSFEADQKRKDAVKAVENPAIAKYVDSNPMASKVSNDDWDALHGVWDKYSKFANELDLPILGQRRNIPLPSGDLPTGRQLLTTPEGRQNLLGAVVSLPAEFVKNAFNLGKTALEQPLPDQMVEDATSVAFGVNVAMLFGMRFGKIPTGTNAGEVGAFLKTAEGVKTRQDIADFIRSRETKPEESGLKLLPAPKEAPSTQVNPVAAQMAEAGQVPHTGLDPIVDQLKVDLSKADADGFNQLFESVQESKTLQRSPDAMASYLEGLTNDKTVSLPATEVAKLYKGETPSEGDNLFGYVPDIARQIEVGLETGGDIQIPMADYLAHTDKAVHEGLKDRLRLRNEGLTVEEAKNLPEPEIITPQQALVHDEIRETMADAYMDSSPGESIFDTAISNVRDEIESGSTHAPNGAAWSDVLSELELRKKQSPDATINAQGDIVPKVTKPKLSLIQAAVKAEKDALYLHPLFKDAKSIGMTEPEFTRYSKKIEDADLTSEAKLYDAVKRDSTRRQTAEWKKNEAEIRAEVESDLKSRPDIAADRFLRLGDLPTGDRVAKVALNQEAVERVLGKGKLEEFTKPDGVFPDDLAPMFGYDTGADLVKGLDILDSARVASRSTPKAYFDYIAKKETAARMEDRYGNLNQNILAEAREAALASNHVDILADELKALARAAGGEPPLSRGEIEKWVKERFAETPVNQVSYEHFRRAAERGGREAEKALLSGKFDEAFQAKQRQLLSLLMAKEAKAFEKLQDKTDKAIKRVLTNQQIASTDQIHLEQLRRALADIGYENRFPAPEGMDSLAQFVADSEGQLAVADFFTDANARPFKSYKDMSVDDYKGMANTVQSMLHVGRAVKQVENVQGKANLDNVVFDIKKELDRFNLIEQPLNPSIPQRAKALGRWIVGWHLLVERMLDYTDQFNPKGPITSYLDRPLRDSNAKEVVLTEKTSRQMRALAKYVDSSLYDMIPNNVLPDPLSSTGYLNLNRKNLRHLMLNMGNESNTAKVVKGFGVDEPVVWDLIHDNATKADWAWVQGMWDMFADLKVEADAMQLRDTGVAADTIPARSVTTKFGEFAGGYTPMVYDKTRSNVEQLIAAKNPMFDNNYYSATTPHGYTIKRTGYAGPIDLTGALLGNKIQAMIHDIAFREAVRNAGKLIRNPEFMQEMTKKWSHEYASLLPGWLKDIANVHNVDDSYAMGAARFFSLIRQNVTSALIALNPGTYIKHGVTAASMSVSQVGAKELAKSVVDVGVKGILENAKDLMRSPAEAVSPEFLQATKDVTSVTERGERARQFIMDSSPMMRQRYKLYSDSVRGAYEDINNAGAAQTAANVRQVAINIGRFPVALSDSISAMPTWLAAYKKSFEKGGEHADAVFEADREVARAHGSRATMDRPRIMRTGEPMRWVTPLYNFWNHMANNYFRAAWDVSALVRGTEEPGATGSKLMNNFFWLVLIPIAVEEMAAPALDQHKQGIGTQIVLATIRHIGSSFIGIRDLTNSLASGYEPSVGLLGTVMRSITSTAKDIRSVGLKTKLSKDWIIHTAAMIGMATGVGGPQVGKVISFSKDLATGADRPRTFNEYRQGFRTGHSKPRIH